jgi:hypothetical protein
MSPTHSLRQTKLFVSRNRGKILLCRRSETKLYGNHGNSGVTHSVTLKAIYEADDMYVYMIVLFILRRVLRGRFQWPRDLRCRSAAERLLGSWVRMPPEAWIFVSCTVFVLSGRGLCGGSIPRPEESYRLWCVCECDQVQTKTLCTCCEQVGRRGKDYETKRVLRVLFL